MSANTLPADAMAMLTDEEREAIESSDLSPEEIAAMQAIANGEDPPPSPEGDDEDEENEEAGSQAAAPTPPADQAASSPPAAAQGAPAASEAAPAPEAYGAAAPRYQASLPADYENKVADLTGREAELKRAFRAGEIEFDDFETMRDELLREREALTIARTKAEISQEMTAQTAEQQWTSTVNSFLATTAGLAPEEGGIDYRKDAEKAADLDTFVRTLAGRQENADKPMTWFLQEAHRRVQALHMGAAPAPAPAPAPSRQTSRKPDLSSVPATLAQVPGGDGPGDVSGEFADVLSLDGEEYEAAIARMTPAQRDRFLRAA